MGKVIVSEFVTLDGITERSGDDYTDRMNSMPKYVASKTLTETTWNTEVLGDTIAEVRALKASVDGDIVVFGSTSLCAALLEAGVVDEIRMLTYPVVRGRGKRLFPEGMKTKLELVSTKSFTSGAVLLTYRPS